MFKTKFSATHVLAVCLFVIGSVESADADDSNVGDPVQFDWYANAATAPTDPAVQAQLIRLAAAQTDGNGSWICSPAGFGKPSTCFNR